MPKEEKSKAAPKASEKKEEKKYSESGMPIPKPKKEVKESGKERACHEGWKEVFCNSQM